MIPINIRSGKKKPTKMLAVRYETHLQNTYSLLRMIGALFLINSNIDEANLEFILCLSIF